MWVDTLRMYYQFPVGINEHFRVQHANILALHNEFVLCHQKYNEIKEDRVFKYEKSLLNYCIRYKHMLFALPKTTKELGLWARVLQNCMYSYSNRIYNHHCAIFGVFIDEKLSYAVEIVNDKIIQMRRKYNQTVPSSDALIIYEWFEKVQENET